MGTAPCHHECAAPRPAQSTDVVSWSLRNIAEPCSVREEPGLARYRHCKNLWGFYLHSSFGIEEDAVNAVLQVMNRSAGRQKYSVVEHKGLGCSNQQPLAPFCWGYLSGSKCIRGAGSQPSAMPFNSLLAWIKMPMEVRKTKLVVTKHHPAVLNLPKTAEIFL